MRRSVHGKRIWGKKIFLIKYNQSLVLFAFDSLDCRSVFLVGTPVHLQLPIRPNAAGPPSADVGRSWFPEALTYQNYPYSMGLPQVSEILIAFGYSFENSAKK